MERVPAASVVKLCVISEGLLIAVSWVWSYADAVQLSIVPSSYLICFGVLSSSLLLLLAFGVPELLSKSETFFPSYKRFKIQVVCPICADLAVRDIIIIASLSGIGEELFFRGVLNGHLERYLGLTGAVAVSSAVFSVIHFGPAIKEFLPLAFVYFLIGVCLSAVTIYSSSLVPAVIAHALYNFTAMLYLRYIFIPELREEMC